LGEIEGAHSAMRLIHLFVDNASYHKAGIVKEWHCSRRSLAK
jgi:hypothetical protein